MKQRSNFLCSTRAHVRPGRSEGTAALYERICVLVAGGNRLVDVARAPWAPSWKTMVGWLRTHPEFKEMYMVAKARRTALFLEMMAEATPPGWERPRAIPGVPNARAREGSEVGPEEASVGGRTQRGPR
jgi:hypothetical protein